MISISYHSSVSSSSSFVFLVLFLGLFGLRFSGLCIKSEFFLLLEVTFVVDYPGVVDLCSKCQVFGEENTESLLDLGTEVSIKKIFDFLLCEIFKERLFYFLSIFIFSILLLFCWCLSKRWRNMLNFILCRLIYLCSLCSIRLNHTIRSLFLVSSFRLGLSSRLRWWLCVWRCLRRKDQQIRDWRYNLWRSSPQRMKRWCVNMSFWGCHPTYRAWQRFDQIPSWCFILGRRGNLAFL